MAVYYTLNVLSGMNKLHLIFNVKHMLVIYYFQRTYIKSLVKYFPVCETLYRLNQLISRLMLKIITLLTFHFLTILLLC